MVSRAEQLRLRVSLGDAYPPEFGNGPGTVKTKCTLCPLLTADKRCSRYDMRPLLCRLYGAVEAIPCPHGCTVTPGLLTNDEGRALIAEIEKLA